MKVALNTITNQPTNEPLHWLLHSRHGRQSREINSLPFRQKRMKYQTAELRKSVCMHNVNVNIDRKQKQILNLYDKYDDLTFQIVNFPFIISHIPAAPAYGVYIPQSLRYSTGCDHYDDLLDRTQLLMWKLLKQVYVPTSLIILRSFSQPAGWPLRNIYFSKRQLVHLVFTLWIPNCDVSYDFRILTIFGSSFVKALMSYLRYLCFLAHSVVLCFSSSCIP